MRIKVFACWVSCLFMVASGAVGAPPEAPGVAAPGTPSNRSPGAKTDANHDLVRPACAQPHPLITEVLYAVPTGGEGDANKDGKREVSGDEFVELVNPHDHAIELKGYTLTDGSATTKSQLRFTFPAMMLPARGVVVVFNGHDSKIPGPVGDAKRAPSETNEQFGKAAVFSMRVSSVRTSFSNAGDAVCLRAPDGKCLQRVRWGKADEKAGGTGFVLDETAPVTNKGSVQRDGIGKDAAWKAHAELESASFSPGVFSCTGTAAAPSATPAPASTPPAPATPAPATTTPDQPTQRGAVHRSHRSHSKRPASAPKF